MTLDGKMGVKPSKTTYKPTNKSSFRKSEKEINKDRLGSIYNITGMQPLRGKTLNVEARL